MTTIIPWIYDTHTHIARDDRDTLFSEIFDKEGLRLAQLGYAGDGINLLKSKKYDFIITGLDLAPGTEMDTQSYAFKEFNNSVKNTYEPQYWRLGMELIRETRSDGSANQKTPVYVITAYHSKEDKRIPEAARAAESLGANKFYSVCELNMVDVLKDIRKEEFGR